MKRIIVSLIILFLSFIVGMALLVTFGRAVCYARLGETLIEAEKRYGIHKITMNYHDMKAYSFIKNEYDIVAVFNGNYIELIEYSKLTGKFTDKEITLLLNKNWDGKWVIDYDGILEKRWITAGFTTECIAIYKNTFLKETLLICTVRMAKQILNASELDKEEKLKEF